MRKHVLFILTASTISLTAAAQDSIRTTTLREVVISASRAEQPVIEAPRSVTVIHQPVIENAIYQSLGDLLKAQSGLYVIGANQTPGTNQNVFMRGSNSNQVAVLVDGVRITDPSSPNAAMDLSEISLANIERIEIIRGSHSTLFGGAAIGGVINLITKKNSRQGFHGGASLQGGMFEKRAWSFTENVNLAYGAKNGIYLNGSLFRQDVNGLDASEKSSIPNFTADRDGFQKTDASIKTGFKDEVWDASIAFKRSHQYTEIDNGAFLDDDNSYLIFDRDLLQYNAAYRMNDRVSVSALGSFSASERFYENDSSRLNATTYDKAYATGTYYGTLQTHELHLKVTGKKLQGLVGAGFYHEKMSFDNYFFYNLPDFPLELITNYDSLDTRTTTSYAFTQWGFDLNRFHFSAGTRLSWHTTAGNFLTFEINPSYALSDFLVFGSLSSGFNAPSLYQLYDPSKTFTGYVTRGNASLKPERSLSVEAGIKKEFSRGSYVTFSAYETVVKNSIEYVYLWNGDKPLQELDYTDDRGDTYLNLGKQTSRGLELDAFFRITGALSLQGNLSWLRTAIEMEGDNIEELHTGGHHIQIYNLGTFLNARVEQVDLIRRPSLAGFARLSYQLHSDVSVGIGYRYTGKRFDATYDGSLGPYGALARINVEGYHLADVDAHWQAGKAIGFALKVENIFDEAYRELAGFQTRGRSVYLKITAKW